MEHTQSIDATRLVKLLGLLGSSHDGEIAAAGRKAHALVKTAKLTWQDIIQPMPVVQPPPDPHKPMEDPWYVVLARQTLRMDDGTLNEFELKFIQDIQRLNQLTDKQEWLLKRLATRCGAFEEAALRTIKHFNALLKKNSGFCHDPNGKAQGR